ncbi:hypothetical protein [Sulfurimonas sp.]|uniref:hypothetical protein n=1 Tax=Sulfurimonas sp. TaxID=2022749 RepID=UPI002AB0BBBF|nr:hypothetical protein [Sulfurimonas sp.]
MLNKEYLKILKPKTRPVQLEPWFFRYLNAGQLKVLSAIVAHADYATRSKDSFASNKTIAFYGGFGLINSDTKDYEFFQTLTTDEKIAYKKKKIKNAIQTVKNIKRQLEELGVIKREIINTKSYAVVDLEWGKERYLKEFDEYFNDDTQDAELTENEINKELSLITKLANEGNISKDNLATQLESLTSKLKVEIKDENPNATIPVEDIDKTVEWIMNTKKIKTKIAEGKIKNVGGYKNSIKKQIQNNTFNGIDLLYVGLVESEREKIEANLYATLEPIERKDEKYFPESVIFDNDKRVIYALYKNKAQTEQIYISISPSLINNIFNPKNYTTRTQNYIQNYIQNYKKIETEQVPKQQNISTDLIDVKTPSNAIDIFIKSYKATNRIDYAFLDASKGLSYKEQEILDKFKEEFETTIIWDSIRKKNE